MNELEKLVSVIREKLPLGKKARQAALDVLDPHVAELLAEAYPRFGTHDEFIAWANRHFGFRKRKTEAYLFLALKNLRLKVTPHVETGEILQRKI